MNLYALALVLKLLLGWPILLGIVVAAVIVAAYITLGGLSSAIYNEVLQFFVILAALIPIAVVGLHDVGGWNGLQDKIKDSKIGEAGLHALQGTQIGDVTNPIGASWIGIVFGLGFVLAFGYWTTNFAEVQRALSAKNLSAAQRTPLIGAFPKLFLPFVMILPGMIALVVIPKLGTDRRPAVQQRDPAADEQVPAQRHARDRADRPDGVVHGGRGGERVARSTRSSRPTSSSPTSSPASRTSGTCASAASRRSAASSISIGTALIASTYDNLMNYLQALFSIFNAPLFATFIIGMFWKRMTPAAGFWGLIAGTIAAAAIVHRSTRRRWIHFGSDLDESMVGASLAFVVDAIVTRRW